MYKGRFRQGDEIYVTLRTVLQGTLTPTIPLSAPTFQVYLTSDPSNKLVNTVMAVYQPGLTTGLFRLSVFFGALFATAGNYCILVRYRDENGAQCQAPYTFELLPSGSSAGADITMTEVVRPEARYILTTTDGGLLIRHKNPS